MDLFKEIANEELAEQEVLGVSIKKQDDVEFISFDFADMMQAETTVEMREQQEMGINFMRPRIEDVQRRKYAILDEEGTSISNFDVKILREIENTESGERSLLIEIIDNKGKHQLQIPLEEFRRGDFYRKEFGLVCSDEVSLREHFARLIEEFRGEREHAYSCGGWKKCTDGRYHYLTTEGFINFGEANVIADKVVVDLPKEPKFFSICGCQSRCSACHDSRTFFCT